MRDEENGKRLILIWERSGTERSEREAAATEVEDDTYSEDEATVTATPLGDSRAPVLRIVSSGFGQTAKPAFTGGSAVSMRLAA